MKIVRFGRTLLFDRRQVRLKIDRDSRLAAVPLWLESTLRCWSHAITEQRLSPSTWFSSWQTTAIPQYIYIRAVYAHCGDSLQFGR